MVKIAICDDEVFAASELEALLLSIAAEKGIELDISIFYNLYMQKYTDRSR